MTVASEANKVMYAGNGAATQFSLTFPVLDESHIRVIITDASGAETEAVAGAFSVDLMNSRVTYPVTGSPLASGNKITLLREVPLLQEADFVNQGAYYSETVEDALDYQMMAMQQMAEALERSVKVDVSSSINPGDLIAEVQASASSAQQAATTASAQVVLAAQQVVLAEDQVALAQDEVSAAAAQVLLAQAQASAAALSAQEAEVAAASLNLPTQTIPADEGKVMRVKAGGGWDIAALIPLVSALPAHYERSAKWTGGANSTAESRRTIVSPSRVTVNINDSGYVLSSVLSLDLNTAANWDSTATDYTVAANRAGKDFYIYACQPVSGTVPAIVLSANSTVPTGYTASNSRKIGGFHCLCVAVGTISGHLLTGYLAGDILPASVWDLRHRPASNPEGMVFDAGSGKWVDIYLSSVSAGELASINGAVVADGVSSPAFHWYKYAQWYGRLKKRMLYQHEFFSASIGANQGTNITGSADPNTTTGHVDTASRRMISNIGCEDTCGAYWQWASDSLSGGADAYANAFDGNDTGVGGQHYRPANRVLLGGDWDNGAYCGSRGSYGDDGPLNLYSSLACRGCAEPAIPLN